jgi:hypothetical protein
VSGENQDYYSEQFGCTPAQYHAGLDKLWGAIQGFGTQGDHVFDRTCECIADLRAQLAAAKAEIERQDARIRMLTIELDGAVNHHDYTRNKVDRALGEPRFNDCDIWTAFERAIAAKDVTIAAQAAEIERLKGERQMSAGFDPASDNGDESAVILMCFNCAYAGPRGEDDEGNVCCPECGARAMEASNG